MNIIFEMTENEIETMLEEEGIDDYNDLQEMLGDSMEHEFEHYPFELEVKLKVTKVGG